MTPQELEFAVFCIENVARKEKKNPSEIYDRLAVNSNLLQTYIIPNFEILHSQSKDYIVEDIVEVMKKEGVA